MARILMVFGTRPEAIKLAPVIRALRHVEDFEVGVCVTAQHREMLDQVLDFFAILPDFDLDLMTPNQTLSEITARGLLGLQDVLRSFDPDCVVVQGDASSSFVGALAAFYGRALVAHVEAGLRSGDKRSPYPEEVNRVLTGHIADFHFAPTERARRNLEEEGIERNVWVVGNTVIDALFDGLDLIRAGSDEPYRRMLPFIDRAERLVLITAHRRESFGRPFEDIASAIRHLAREFRDVTFVYPVHLNPNVKEPIHRVLGSEPNVHLIEPLEYPALIWLMDRSHLVLTDSGGIQEEAPALGKPVVVMRDVTERVEGLEAGTAVLVGTDRDRIIEQVSTLLTDADAHSAMARAVNPYGDGTSSRRIAEILSERL